ncbi:uncharacterized protein LOC129738839 [Uranotaenia lowii]|uniref:uncharacterized protein LOC129738839 n=1 Tax=Uranotaenia lowii TaxID=190385 RepID=UPI002479039F|nr:uncharacterized protein LOC129738839 [Uranotaenia lowii]
MWNSRGTAILFGLLAVVILVEGFEDAQQKGDSYLAAFENSQHINANKASGAVRVPRDEYSSLVQSSSYDYSLASSSGYGASAAGGSYGAPAPKPAYGAPKPVYGPPPPMSSGYGPPAPVYHGKPYLSPENWLLSKLKLKFDWFVLAKILLKIVIFKKIVKFIALLCLLFFIPTLKPMITESGGDSEGDDKRRSYDLSYNYDSRLNEVTRFALKALESFTIDNELYCPEENLLSCRAKRMFDVIDEEYPLKKILGMYVPHSSSFRNLFGSSQLSINAEPATVESDDSHHQSIDSSNEGAEQED